MVFKYPPLARQARISGDVLVKIGVRPDGSTVSTEVISGHPLFKQAALDSAQKSKFSCYACRDSVTYFSMTYTFGIRIDSSGRDCDVWKTRERKCFYLWRCGKWEQNPPGEPVIGQTLDRIIILAAPACVEAQSSQ